MMKCDPDLIRGRFSYYLIVVMPQEKFKKSGATSEQSRLQPDSIRCFYNPIRLFYNPIRVSEHPIGLFYNPIRVSEKPMESALFQKQAKETAESRFQGGIHFRTDNEVGLEIGRKIAGAVIKKIARDGANGELKLAKNK
ncbi:MAG: hypothetical protein ACK4TA_24515 [Saprospiraceae bacterium]